jgi:hypothetical protein
MANYVKGTVTKDPNKVLDTLSGNATVDASPKGGVAAVAKGTDNQSAMEQLNNYYRQQAAKEQSDLAYADYLTDGKVSQDLKYGNYLTNGRFSGYNSYADYLASIGQTPQDSQKVRDASVAQANAAYERSLANYGQKGEQLARSGLSNTGYSDASNNAAYAAKQNAILQADATKAATDQSNRLGYAQYLQAYDAQQQSKMMSVLEYTTQMGMNGEQAKQYAKSLGFDDTVSESIGNASEAYYTTIKAKEEESKEQALKEYVLQAGMTAEQAKRYAKALGFDDAASERIGLAAASYESASKGNASDLYNTLVSNENFAYDPAMKNSLRQQLLNSGYDEATVDDVLGRLDKTYTVGQKDSYDLIMKALTDDSAYEKIGSMIDGFNEMSDNDKAVAIDKYVASSNLSNEQKTDFFYEKIYQKIMKDEKASDVLNELASYKSIGMPESVYNKVAYKMMGYISVDENGIPRNFNGTKLRTKVTGDGNNGVGKKIGYLGNEPSGTLKAGNDGKLYMSTGNGKWYAAKIRINGFGYSDEEEEALNDITYQRLLHRQNGGLSSRKVRSGK